MMDSLDFATAAEPFNYGTEAELFSAGNRNGRRQALGYRRFAKAADAIRFAIEELPPQLLAGSYLEVAEIRYEQNGIRRLYDSAGYPFVRGAAVSAG
jgi:hypothetical protein